MSDVRAGDYEIFDDRSLAERNLVDSERVADFVDEADFEDSTLVVGEYGASQDADLSLRRITRSDRTTTVHVDVSYPRSAHDDVDFHAILVALSGVSSAERSDIRVAFDDPDS